MSIKSFKISKLHVPAGRMIGDSMCHYDAFRVVALRLETASGLVGWGFGEKAYGGHFAKEAAWNRPVPCVEDMRAEFTSRFAPWILGRPALGVKLGTPPSLFAGDDALVLATRMALWDLIGKEAGTPLYRLLGGDRARESLPSYASACEFPMPDEFLKEFYGKKVQEGFRMFKIKLGHPDPHHDLRRLLIMREVIGRGASLAADANKAWTAPETIERLQFFNAEGADLAYIEDPLDPDDLEGYRYLAEHCPVPVVGHDYIREPGQTRPLLEAGALDMLRARDGLDYSLGLLPLAREFNRPVIGCNTLFEWNIHAALAFPEFDRIEFADIRWNELPITPIRIEDGRMFPPPGPGHGFDPKPDVFEAWTVNE